ncbi:neuronal acetylcholine receptor subunit alpha-7-like [Saccostrea echinata]|uniref:neuronal acetylcholine receptor subunit alpha-7-like n=1 Tax=Saccostrea echinata TaxID=191078 RepID=UPI002A826E62|nr:neuronal acetylcholine receptor subunit alpha-7-like [Saccostrea echinata]
MLVRSPGYFTFLLALFGRCVESQTPADVNSLMEDLFANYSHKVRPVSDQFSPIILDVSMFLCSVNQVDEVNEKLVTTGFLGLSWIDDLLQWDPVNRNDIKSIFLPQNDIWKPDLVLKNGFERFHELGGSFYFLSVHNTGHILWYPYEVFETRCSIDITYFPYDKQTCKITFIVWSYSVNEVIITKSSNGISFYEYEENSVWTMLSTNSEIKRDAYESEISFTIELQRKSQYYVLNMILPIICLGFLSLLVFVIPVDAGEKMGYSVTVFLAFAVFLTIISEELPANSENTSFLSVYLVLQMLIGAFVLVISAIQLRLHHRKSNHGMSKVFVGIVRFEQCLRCVKGCRSSGKVDAVIVVKSEEKEEAINEHDIEWNDVSSAIDFLCFWMFFLINVGVTLFLFLHISS